MASERPEKIAGASAGDAFLAGLGVVRLAIPIPFVEAGGPVNVYLIENPDGTLTLFDSGLGTDEARSALEAGFAEAGRRIEEVRRIILSHGHVDHYGSARWIAARSGAQVLIHPADAAKVAERRADHAPAMREYLLRLGVPGELIGDMLFLHEKTERFAEKLDAVEPLQVGARFTFKHFEAEVLHMPGHTPGLVCLHDAAHKLLFTDDHLLARVSPNPLIELGPHGEADKFRALEAYFASAQKVRDMDLDWIAPGHGAPFQGHRATLDSLLKFYDKRQAKICGALATSPRSAYELVHDVFGRAGALQLFLMLSEILGNLEVLETRGQIRRRPGELPYRYELGPQP